MNGFIAGAALLFSAAARQDDTPAAPDAALSAKVDAYLAPVLQSHEFSGVVLIAKGERVLVERAYGKSDWIAGTPMKLDTRFRIASITKCFTAASVAILAERGELSLVDPLSEYVEGFPRGEKIVVEHLLGHTSGVVNPDSLPSSEATLATLIAELSKKPLAFAPGTQSRYSNGGYALLARVIEKTSGGSWEQFLHDEIFEPLALDATSVDRKSPPIQDLAHGFVAGPGSSGLVEAPNQGVWAAIGSGAVVSSTRDLWKFGRAIRDEKLFQRSKLAYPYGWGVRKRLGRDTIEQSGIVNGAASYLELYLADDVIVVALSNVQSGLLEEIGKGLGALAFGETPPALPACSPEVASDAAERQRWLGRYTNPDVTTVELLEENGALRCRWGNARETSYVTPTGPGKAYVRQDSVALERIAEPQPAIVIRWPDGSEHRFTRMQ
jgi:CubicO group peptidase (beta-lactamase class C family)